MKEKKFAFTYCVYDSINDLEPCDGELLRKAQEATGLAYAPYSNFLVGAAAMLNNGQLVMGSNQENASFPVGLCAERVLLASASSIYPNVPIKSIAITYRSDTVSSNHPVAPCGICRQSLQEYEARLNFPIRLILGGLEGPVYIISNAFQLLPFSFSGDDLK